MSDDARKLSIDPGEYGEPLHPELREVLEKELELARNMDFSEDHPYDEALSRTLHANIMTLGCEKIIARHCFHMCAEKIRENGIDGRDDPSYRHYISLLRQLPTDWFDDVNGQLLDEIDLWN